MNEAKSKFEDVGKVETRVDEDDSEFGRTKEKYEKML